MLDFKRIEAYAKNLSDFHLIIDLLPILSMLYFRRQLGNLKLHGSQAAILAGMGLQHRLVESVSKCKELVKI